MGVQKAWGSIVEPGGSVGTVTLLCHWGVMEMKMRTGGHQVVLGGGELVGEGVGVPKDQGGVHR